MLRYEIKTNVFETSWVDEKKMELAPNVPKGGLSH
jgi:hypothetical protein